MEAYILLQLMEGNEEKVLDEVKDIDNVRGASLVFGEWDLIAKVDVESNEELATLLLEKFRSNENVRLTSSLIVAKQ